MYVDVLVDHPVRQALTYQATPAILPYVQPGSLLEVSFGRISTYAVVVALRRTKPRGTTTVKPVRRLLAELWVQPDILRAAAALTETTGEPPGICLFRLLPPPGKQVQSLPPAVERPHAKAKRYHVAAPRAIRFKQYRSLIASAVAANEQVLVVLPAPYRPEFLESLPNEWSVAVVDASMKPTVQRRHAAQFARGEISVLVGTRHSIGWPAAALRWLIVDDVTHRAHDDDQRPYADSATVATARSVASGTQLLLGTAIPTPGMVLAEQQRGALRIRSGAPSGHITLRQRNPLADLDRTPNSNDRILLVAPRQGLGGTISCQQCDWILHCVACGGDLNVQAAAPSFSCYHCSVKTRRPSRCAHCASGFLVEYGIGTQAVQAALQAQLGVLPATITVGTATELERPLHYDHIIFLYADSPLLSPVLDRPLQYLRAVCEARDLSPRLTIHTRHPTQPLWSLLGTHAAQAYRQLLHRREEAKLPPFWRTISFPKPIQPKQLRVIDELTRVPHRRTEDHAMMYLSVPANQYAQTWRTLHRVAPTLRYRLDSILDHA